MGSCNVTGYRSVPYRDVHVDSVCRMSYVVCRMLYVVCRMLYIVYIGLIFLLRSSLLSSPLLSCHAIPYDPYTYVRFVSPEAATLLRSGWVGLWGLENDDDEVSTRERHGTWDIRTVVARGT